MNRLDPWLSRWGALVLVSAAFLTAPSAAPAKLVIKSEFLPSQPPPNLIGGGNLVDIFNTAAATWEKAFPGVSPGSSTSSTSGPRWQKTRDSTLNRREDTPIGSSRA
jgi:hypothetical protein